MKTRYRLKNVSKLKTLLWAYLFVFYRGALAKFIKPISDFIVPKIEWVNDRFTTLIGYEWPPLNSLLVQLKENDSLLVIITFLLGKILISLLVNIFKEKDPIKRAQQNSKVQFKLGDKWLHPNQIKRIIRNILIKEIKRYYRFKIKVKSEITPPILKAKVLELCQENAVIVEALLLLTISPEEFYMELHKEIKQYITDSTPQ